MAEIKNGRRPGRRLTLNPDLIYELCSFIENGGSNKDAALLCNVDESTLYEWVNRGDADIADGIESLHSELSKSLKAARAKFKLYHVQQIHKAAKDPQRWQASAWLLERQFNSEWGKKDKVEVEHSGNIANPAKGMTKEELRELLGEK